VGGSGGRSFLQQRSPPGFQRIPLLHFLATVIRARQIELAADYCLPPARVLLSSALGALPSFPSSHSSARTGAPLSVIVATAFWARLAIAATPRFWDSLMNPNGPIRSLGCAGGGGVGSSVHGAIAAVHQLLVVRVQGWRSAALEGCGLVGVTLGGALGVGGCVLADSANPNQSPFYTPIPRHRKTLQPPRARGHRNLGAERWRASESTGVKPGQLKPGGPANGWVGFCVQGLGARVGEQWGSKVQALGGRLPQSHRPTSVSRPQLKKPFTIPPPATAIA